MTEGLDVKTWLTILGVIVMFFILPAYTLEHDRRKKLREASSSDKREGA